MVFGDEAFGSCTGHEGGALINRISALIKDAQRARSSLAAVTM